MFSFPASWPTYAPARKVCCRICFSHAITYDAQLANWLEAYAETLELNVWTSATVTKAMWINETQRWRVKIELQDVRPRYFDVKHLVFASGMSGGSLVIPEIPERVRTIRHCRPRRD